MLTNQRRVYVDQSERRSSKFNQSQPSSQNATRGTDGIKGTAPSFLPSPPVTRTRHHVYLGADIGEHTKNTSASSGVTESSAISSSCNPGVFDSGAT